MSETKFTRGVWTVQQGFYVESEKDRICEVLHPDDLEAKANAHLIAAAPEMYETLELINETIDQIGLVRFKSAINIEKLLAKARGEHE